MLSPSLLSIPSTMFVTAHDLCPIEERQFGRFFKNSIRAVRSAPLFSIIPTYPRLALHSSTQRLRAFRILSKPGRVAERDALLSKTERTVDHEFSSLPPYSQVFVRIERRIQSRSPRSRTRTPFIPVSFRGNDYGRTSFYRNR